VRSKYAQPELLEDCVQALPVTVVFTTVSDTLDALRKAAVLAHELRAKIRILVAHVVPYPLPLEQPKINTELRMRRVRTLIERDSIETRIEIHLCRDARQCIQESLEPHSLVIIGGRQSRWPLTRENRLARGLKRAGHQVISTAPGIC
jgi:hypothetical protein